MSTVSEIEAAVTKLSRQELSSFRDWFSRFDADAWDKQFEADVAAGHLDALADEAIRDLRGLNLSLDRGVTKLNPPIANIPI